MTDTTAAPPTAPETPAEAPPAPQVTYSQSGGLVALLARLGISVAFTSYQSGILYFPGPRRAMGAHLSQTGIAKPMGLTTDGQGRLVLSAGFEVIDFENPLAPHEQINHLFDRCFVPRTLHMTGQLDAHDVGIADRWQHPVRQHPFQLPGHHRPRPQLPARSGNRPSSATSWTRTAAT